METHKVYELIREALILRPELRFKTWPNDIPRLKEISKDLKPMQGGCFIATQVFCELVPEAEPYCFDDRLHFWAQIGDEIWDATFDQFDYSLVYEDGRKTRFKQLSKRSAALLEEVQSLSFTRP